MERAAPLMTQLDREVVEPSPSPSLLAAAPPMDRTAEIDAMMAELIAASREDPFFRPPFHPLVNEVHHSLLLYHHPELSISLGVTGVDMLAAKKTGRTGPASINLNGYSTLLRFLKAGDATMSFGSAADRRLRARRRDRALPAGRLPADRGRRGDRVDGRHQSFVIEHAEGDILFFQAVVRAGCAPVGVEYDSDSLQLLGASSTDEVSSRLQMMVSLLRALAARTPSRCSRRRSPARCNSTLAGTSCARCWRWTRTRPAGAATDGRRRPAPRHPRRGATDAGDVLRGHD